MEKTELVKKAGKVLFDIFRAREGKEEEAIGCITRNGEVIILTEHEDLSALYGCKAFDVKCVRRIREDLIKKGCVMTFHLHPSKTASIHPSGQDIIFASLMQMPDMVVSNKGICIYEPIKKVEPEEVFKIDETCWLESERDYWAWKGCVRSKLPVKTEFLWWTELIKS